MPTTRSKKFQCQQCGFAAATQNALNSHYRVHTRQNQSPSMIVNTLSAVEKGAIAVSSVSNYINYFMWFLDLVITYPCFSVFMSSICYTVLLIVYGIVLQYIPFFATSGSLVGLTWTAHTHNTLYLKQNPLPYADFMILYGAIPVVDNEKQNWFQCSGTEEKCSKDLETRGKEIIKQIGIMKELINTDWESLGYTEDQAVALVWNMPTYVDEGIPQVHPDNIRSIHFPDHKSVMPTEKEREDMDKDYRKSWGLQQYTPMAMLNTYTRTLTSWINHKNGTSDMSRHTLYLKLDFIEQQHIPWVKYIQKNKHIDAKEMKAQHYSGNNFITYSNWADDMFITWCNKGKITNTTYYVKFANIFSTEDFKQPNTDPKTPVAAELKILKTGSV